MRSSILAVASSMAFFSLATTRAVSPRDTKFAEIQFFGQESCTRAETIGDISVYVQDVEECHTFPTDKTVKSIYTEYLSQGCTLETFSDIVCSFDPHDVNEGICLSGDKSYGSYKIVCDPSAN